MKINKQQLLRYMGDYSQLFGIKEYMFTAGKAKSVKAFDINNGTGLEFTVLADRGLDIGRLAFNSRNFAYLSKTGIVAPAYYYGNDRSFFNNFLGGFLTTCGLRNVGSSSSDNGEFFGIHGLISNTPGEEVCASTVWDEGYPVMTISGQMRETRFFGENMLLKRKISCPFGTNKFLIHDCVENIGFKREQLMILYHFNLGFPLLAADSELLSPSREVVPRNAEALKGIESYHQMQEPTPGYVEQVFYHDLKADEEGKTCVALVNRRMELGIAFHFNKKQLFNLTQWKQMGEGEYVLGIEPCNCYVGGRLDPLNKDIAEYLESGESKEIDIEVEILSGMREIEVLENKIKNF